MVARSQEHVRRRDGARSTKLAALCCAAAVLGGCTGTLGGSDAGGASHAHGASTTSGNPGLGGMGGVAGAGGTGGGGGSGGGGAGTTSSSGAGGMQNVVQIDMHLVLTDDTVRNNGTGTLDATQSPVDRGGYDLLTQSAATQVGGAAARGLPDDASFPANADHPDVKLHWNNADDGGNSLVMRSGSTLSFSVPSRRYKQVQIYAFSTEGSSSIDFTLHYRDGTDVVRTVTFLDWLNKTAAPGQFFLIGQLDRMNTTFDAIHSAAISGVNLDPDPTKVLTGITVAQPTTDWFVFYGATAW